MGYDVKTLLADLQLLMVEGRELGNVSRCEIITDDIDVLQKFRNFAPDIKHVKPASAILLGAPIGGEQSVDEAFRVKLDELRRLSSRVSQLHERVAVCF